MHKFSKCYSFWFDTNILRTLYCFWQTKNPKFYRKKKHSVKTYLWRHVYMTCNKCANTSQYVRFVRLVQSRAASHEKRYIHQIASIPSIQVYLVHTIMGLTHPRTHVSMINMVNLFFFILEQNIISSFEPFSILKYA